MDEPPRTQLDVFDPLEIDAAADAGIWPGDARSRDSAVRNNTPNTVLKAQLFARYAIDRRANPYYVHGDFDRDGRMDVAVTIRETASGQTGIAIIRATLDSVVVYGAGRLYPDSRSRGVVTHLVVSGEPAAPELVVGFDQGAPLSVRWSEGQLAATSAGGFLSRAAEADRVAVEPPLLARARQRGLIPSDGSIEVVRRWNPYYITGNFDGDRAVDLACLVRLPRTDQQAVLIIHGILDSLRFVFDSPGYSMLRPVPAGRTITPFPLDGLSAEALRPHVLRSDAIEVGYRGPYAAVLIWRAGRYVTVTTSD
jgi:hypothetical protein